MTILQTQRKVGTYDPDTRGTAILVGLLFLTATLTFMVGDGLITSAFQSSNAQVETRTLAVGAGLIAACGVAVAAIGVALFGLLRRFHGGLAWGQMIFRLVECVVIFAVGGYMLASHQPVSYEAAIYAFTGTAGLMAAYALGRFRLIPGWLARLGIIGYVAIAVAVPSDLLNIATLDSPAGMLLYLPGGAFELILPILLITRGFRRVDGEEIAIRPPSERVSA